MNIEKDYKPAIYFHRQSGRTTRMLEEARRLHKEGRRVYVLVHSEQYKETLKRRPENGGISFETWESMRNSIDERTLTLRSGWAHIALLIDHHALEERYAAVLEHLRMWSGDQPARER